MNADGDVVGAAHPRHPDEPGVVRKEVRIAVLRSVGDAIVDELAGRSHAASADLLGETGELRQGEFHGRNREERPASLAALDDVAAFELGQRLPDGGAADAEERLQFLLRGEGITGRELPLLDQPLDGLLDRRVEGQTGSTIERRTLQGHPLPYRHAAAIRPPQKRRRTGCPDNRTLAQSGAAAKTAS